MECALHCRAAAGDVRWQGQRRARPTMLVKVLTREVSIHNHARQFGALGTRIDMLVLPRFRRILARELKEGLAIEIVLGLEVFIETAARQAGLGHDLVDCNSCESSS